MADNKKFSEYKAAVNAVSPVTTNGALTGVKINATGADRVAFVFSFGIPLDDAAVSSGLGIWKASTSGAAYTRAGASFGALTSGAINGKTAVLDVNVDRAKPWLLVSGQMDSSNCPLSCVAIIDNYDNRPPTSLSAVITAND
jgi:hypothetical protein